MVTTRDLLLKWSTYAFCILLMLCAHSFLLGNVRLWGVMPFLPPILLAVTASFEAPYESALFGLVFGIVCDLLFAAPPACLYTVSFTVCALISSFLARSALQPGFFCSLAVSAISFLITDLFWTATLLLGGHATLSAAGFLFLRELLVSLLLLPIVYPVLSRLHRFFTI